MASLFGAVRSMVRGKRIEDFLNTGDGRLIDWTDEEILKMKRYNLQVELRHPRTPPTTTKCFSLRNNIYYYIKNYNNKKSLCLSSSLSPSSLINNHTSLYTNIIDFNRYSVTQLKNHTFFNFFKNLILKKCRERRRQKRKWK